MQATAKETVEAFWETMTTNDCGAVGALLADDFRLEWPQSGEVIRGRDNFAAVNRHDPVNSPRRFTVHQVTAEGSQVVSDVGVTDGVVKAKAIIFSTIKDGLITKQLEFWPDPFAAPE